MKTYQYHTNSNAAPFCSDSASGFIKADDPMEALAFVVAKYGHPAGLFSAIIKEPTVENKLLARYESPRCATQSRAGCGTHQWREDGLYVNDVKAPKQSESFELVA